MNTYPTDPQIETTPIDYTTNMGSSGALMQIFTELATTQSKLRKEMLTKKYKKRVRKIFNKMGVK